MGLDNPLHIAFLVVILLLIFGAKRLPEIGRSLGSGMREFKSSVTGESNSQHTALPPAQRRPQPHPPRPQPLPPRRPPRRRRSSTSSSPPRAQPSCKIGPEPIASKAEPGTLLSWSRSSSRQCASDAPPMYHDEPLSATISP
jgi:sec-independent protein translocase protein TatA